MNKRTIGLSGHIIDSLTLTKTMGIIMDKGGEFDILEIDVGRKKSDISHAKIEVSADSPELLESILDELSVLGASIDDIKEVNDPDMWIKANPNLGITVSYETYQLDKERAEKAPASRNDILAKRFGIPCEGYTYFFSYSDTEVHRRKRKYNGMPCALGGDLSQGDDFCAFTFLFPLGNMEFGVKCRSYITNRKLINLPEALRFKYEQFIDEGSLIIMDGTILDMMAVYDDLDNHIIQNDYDVRAFGYDPYNATEFIDRWAKENSAFGVTKVIQGSRTESVPLGELKVLAEDRRLLFDEQIMQFCMGNCIVLEDTNGNRKLHKKMRT